MGFLDRANEKRAEIASAVSAPTNNSNISFFSFTKKYGLNCCCSFSKKANHFYITNSIGFDGDSILKSYSTDDFWNGVILPEDRIITYTQADTNLNSFKQFFSDTLLFDLESLTILKTSKNTILFVLNISDKVDTTTLATDFNLISENIISDFNEKSEYDNFVVNFDEALDSYIYTKDSTKNNKDFSIVIKDSLFNEIFNSLQIFFSTESVKNNENPFEITINIPSEFSIKEELLFRHLILNLSFILEDSASLISIYKN